MPDNDMWAANIAFTGSKAQIKEILNFVEEFEEAGKIDDYTGIHGPFESLQLMLKRRKENLALGLDDSDEE